MLVHSPLTGPLVWEPVAAALRRRGQAAVVPPLPTLAPGSAPYWQRHAEAVAGALDVKAAGAALLLVGHSGAGPLLPAIGQHLRGRVAAYLFVDAGLPLAGRSRLQEIEQDVQDLGPVLRRHLEDGGVFPTWSEEDLRGVVADDGMRAALVAGLRPHPLAFFTEAIPQPAGWPDAPCAYVQLSAAYARAGEDARRRGWPYRMVEGGHFHMLVDPGAVSEALLDAARVAGRGGSTAPD
ncbi:MAG: hypothetical protein NVSMB65_11020 [Chloroflexota bacterium]